MKKLMTTSLASLLFACVVLSAAAQETAMGQKTQELGIKIGQEVMQEVMAEAQSSGKQPTPEVVGQKMVAKMRANQDIMKSASTEDCILIYGQEKASNCQCITDKTDYDTIFSLMEKQIVNPKADFKEEIKNMESKTKETYKSCGLDIKIAKEATEKTMKEVMRKKG